MKNNRISESDKMFVFKVKDYITLLVGRYNEKGDYYYIQRGDGTILNTYESHRITFKRELTIKKMIKT